MKLISRLLLIAVGTILCATGFAMFANLLDNLLHPVAFGTYIGFYAAATVLAGIPGLLLLRAAYSGERDTGR